MMSVAEANVVSAETQPAGRLWRNRSFQLIFVSAAIAMIGNQFSLVAIPWLALKLTGNPALLAISLSFVAIPQVVLMLIGGTVADHFSARNILTLTKCANGILLLILAITLVTGALRTPGLLALVFLLGASSAFAVPTTASFLPRVVPKDQLASANAILMMTRQLTTLVGPVIAGGAITWLSTSGPRLEHAPFAEASGVAGALAVDATTCVVSAAIVRFIRLLPEAAIPASTGVLKSITEGLRWLRSDRPVYLLFFYSSAMVLLLAGPAQVGIPVMVDTRLGMGATGLGILLTSMSLGAIAGMSVAGMHSRRRIAPLGIVILVMDAIAGLCLLLLAQTHSIVAAALLWFVPGLGEGYVQVGMMTWIQRRIPHQMLGRVTSVLMLGMVGAAPLSAALAAVVLAHTTIVTLLTVSGAMFTVFALGCLSSATIRSIDEAAPGGASA